MPLPPPINVGLAANDGKGDPLRTAYQKANARDEYLDQRITSVSTPTMVAGPVTTLPPGSPATASVSGTAPNFTLDLGLPAGTAGAGAPTSPDILAIAEMGRLERSLTAAGVPDEASLILDFVRGVHFASKTAIAASIMTLIAALGGISGFGRGSIATYWDIDGVLKTAAVNVPRVEYDPLTRLPLGLLVENQSRTNVVPYAMLGSGTSIYGANLTAGASVFVDGTTRMSRLTNSASPGSVNTSHCDVYPTVPDDASIWTFSVFLRPGTSPKTMLMLGFSGGGTTQEFVEIDWATKTTLGLGKLQDLGGGRYRASITAANNASGNTVAICRVYTRGNDADHVVGEYVDIGGYQLENAAGASSFIETTGSAATRALDALTLRGNWLPAGPLTSHLECSLSEIRVGTFSFPAALNNASYEDQLLFVEGASSPGATVAVYAGGVAQFVTSPTSTPLDQIMRLACAYSATDWGYARDNVLVNSGGAITLPTGFNRLDIGGGGFMGHIRRLIVFPQRLSNTKVQALSNQAAWS